MQRIVVIGLGRFGMVLARSLAKSGVEVIAIDAGRELIDEIKDDVHLAVCLDSTDEHALLSQDIPDADVIVIAIGENFEASLLTAAILRKLTANRIICRAQTPIHAEIFRRMGADEIIQPESESGLHLAQKLAQPHLRQLLELADGFKLVEVEAPTVFHGKTLQQVHLRARHQVNAILIHRYDDDGTVRSEMPMPAYVIQPRDVLVLLGTEQAIASLPKG